MIDDNPEWYQVFKLKSAKLSRKRRAPLQAAIAFMTGSWNVDFERVLQIASGDESVFCECCLSFLTPRLSSKELHHPSCKLAIKAREVLSSIELEVQAKLESPMIE